FKGVCATTSLAPAGCQVIPFTTNDDLQAHLARAAAQQEIEALFHVAALCDYKVMQVENQEGKALGAAKIESRDGGLRIVLEPATKVIVGLRALFPRARIVGWKY